MRLMKRTGTSSIFFSAMSIGSALSGRRQFFSISLAEILGISAYYDLTESVAQGEISDKKIETGAINRNAIEHPKLIGVC